MDSHSHQVIQLGRGTAQGHVDSGQPGGRTTALTCDFELLAARESRKSMSSCFCAPLQVLACDNDACCMGPYLQTDWKVFPRLSNLAFQDTPLDVKRYIPNQPLSWMLMLTDMSMPNSF